MADSISLLDTGLAGLLNMFAGIYSFHLGFPVVGVQLVIARSHNWYFCGGGCNVSFFISDFVCSVFLNSS